MTGSRDGSVAPATPPLEPSRKGRPREMITTPTRLPRGTEPGVHKNRTWKQGSNALASAWAQCLYSGYATVAQR